MHRALIIFLIGIIPTYAQAHTHILCVRTEIGIECFTAQNLASAAEDQAFDACKARYSEGFCHGGLVVSRGFENACAVVYSNSRQQTTLAINQMAANAVAQSLAACINSEHGGFNCTRVAVVCDGTGVPLAASSTSAPVPQLPPAPLRANKQDPASPQIIRQVIYLSNDSLSAAVVGFCVALLLAVGILFRASIANWFIHDNLPRSLPVYAEDIRVLFKRTQRVNWYGRVIFGIVSNFAMTHDQLTDVRKYWLGRVIAFDSLRRQRQNQLAAMHMQLAATAKSEAHDRKNFWSRRWATLRSFFKKLFWIIIALFNLVMALFFIRINIARLVRGAVIESKDLTLILQAKEAIEETAEYLKEYLITANTFDGRDEIV